MTQHFCIECGSELHSYTQQSGPYNRNAAGELVATGHITIVECTNARCDLWMVTASLENYPTTTANYLRSRRAVSHA